MGAGGLLAILLLVADAWALLNVARSGASAPAKLLWAALILLLPLLGLLAWLVMGPRAAAHPTRR